LSRCGPAAGLAQGLAGGGDAPATDLPGAIV